MQRGHALSMYPHTSGTEANIPENQPAPKGPVDLHTHSNASDGDYSPAQLVREAKERGLSAIALTDHDTLGGLKSAQSEAKAAGIHFIPGIEINITWTGENNAPRLGPGGEFHLLGLGIQSPNHAFLAAIDELSRCREARNHEILDRMHKLNIEATWEDILALSRGESRIDDTIPQSGPGFPFSVGRPHFASLLVKKKIVKTRKQAFARYLKMGKPLYVPKTGIAFADAAALIRESGGIPVLAHPMSLYVAWGRLADLIKALKDRGLMGIEAWHPVAGAKSCRRLEELGKTLGLYITEGSDFHGTVRLDRQLGYSHRGRKISNAILEAIPELGASYH